MGNDFDKELGGRGTTTTTSHTQTNKQTHKQLWLLGRVLMILFSLTDINILRRILHRHRCIRTTLLPPSLNLPIAIPRRTIKHSLIQRHLRPETLIRRHERRFRLRRRQGTEIVEFVVEEVGWVGVRVEGVAGAVLGVVVVEQCGLGGCGCGCWGGFCEGGVEEGCEEG